MAETENLGSSLAGREDTDETSLAGRLPLIGSLRRLSRGLGRVRSALLVLGWLCLSALGLYLGWPRLEQLCLWLASGLELLLQKIVGLFGGQDTLGGILSFAARYRLAQHLAWAWGGWLLFVPVVLCWPRRAENEELGYVVPGSGWLARGWAVIGRQLYRLKRALIFSFRYLLDFSLEKAYLPLTVLLVLALGTAYLSLVLENLLFELHLAVPALIPSASWMPLASGIAAGLCALLFGVPWLIESFRQPHRRALERRTRGQKLIWRLLAGLLGAITVAVPLLWLALGLATGELFSGG